MTATLLVIHILLAVALIGVILIQRTSSDGGGLMGGSSSNLGGIMTVRGTANLLTRMTSIIAGCFIATSILLTILAGSHHQARSIADEIKPAPVGQKAGEAAPTSTPTQQPAAGSTDKPAPATPAVPVSQ